MEQTQNFINDLVNKYVTGTEYKKSELGTFYYYDSYNKLNTVCYNESGDCFMEDYKIEIKSVNGDWIPCSAKIALEFINHILNGANILKPKDLIKYINREHLRGVEYDELKEIVGGR